MSLLKPYRVLDLTDERGLLAAKLFGDLGADVVQIEPPSGSPARDIGPFVEAGAAKGRSLFWEAYACNRRGITCNLDDDRGRELFKQLCAKTDFVFESESPGIMARRGLAWSDLKAVNPQLIHVSITAFGSDGPKSGWADSDLTLWAAGGALYPNRREPDRAPFRLSLPQAWMHAAADAAGAALIAHFARVASGRGQHVDVSAQQSVAQATLARILSAAVGDPLFEKPELAASSGVRRADRSGSGSATARSKWEAADGHIELHLSMGAAAGKFTNTLMAWLNEHGALDDDIAGIDWIAVADQLDSGACEYARIDRAYEQVAAFFLGRTKQDIMENAVKRRLPIGPVNSVEDLAASPQLAARGYWDEVDSSAGPLRLPGAWAQLSIPAFAAKRRAPRLGEHNAEVYGERLALSAADLAGLREAGCI